MGTKDEANVLDAEVSADERDAASSKRRLLGQLCARSLLTEMMEQMYEQETKRAQKDVVRTVRQHWGAIRVDVAEIYSLLRMAATAKDKAQSIDVTTEMNYLMSLGEHKSPHEDDERGIWEKELYDGKDFFDDVT